MWISLFAMFTASFSSTPTAGPSSAPRHRPGTGRSLCVICGIRPHFDDGRRAFPTCGNTCARKLQGMTATPANNMPQETKPMCIICKIRPQFNNGRRAFPTCGNTCGRALEEMGIPQGTTANDFSGYPPFIKMCYICHVRPRYQKGLRAYPTCSLTCAARLNELDRLMSIDFNPSTQDGSSRARGKAREVVEVPNQREDDDDLCSFESPVSGGKSPVKSTYFFGPGDDLMDVDEPESTFECIICLETHKINQVARFACQHRFCRPCLRDHISVELSEHRYPIVCPSCKIDDKISSRQSIVDDRMLQFLGLGEKEITAFYDLQLAAHSTVVHCQKCKETMFVDRREYERRNVIECPLPRCNYLWCKHCNIEVKSGVKHSCDGTNELESLMKENGWQHCPGCQTPVQKSHGCNHITCLSPGCNTHFCYTCGKSIITSLHSATIREAVKTHYAGCQLF